MLKDLSERSEQPELMDDFREGPKKLRFVFDDINRVNKILGGTKITVTAVGKLMQQNPKENYTILDMGCGDGQMLREIANYCRKRNINISLIGIDLNSEVLQLAKEASSQYDEIVFLHQDILEIDASELSCDIVINTLTMHHFTNTQLVVFLNKFIELGKIGIVINDLHRSTLAYYLFKLFSVIFIKTKHAKIDGLISIRKGFIKSELIAYSKGLPSVTHDIQWKWAFRYVWVMQPYRLNGVICARLEL
ncbi:MAG: methyltransferase domain-containing protein [Flavobacteriaceae bacterium]